MMHIGQAGGTLAWLCLRDRIEPRDVAGDMGKVRELQLRLVRGIGGPGVLLWPWHDIAPDDLWFEAVNMLAVRGIWLPERDSLFFQPDRLMTRRELASVLVRLCRSLADEKDWVQNAAPVFTDVAEADRPFIEAMVAWGDFRPHPTQFNPEGQATRATLAEWLKRLGLPVAKSLSDDGKRPVTRAEAAQHLWRALTLTKEWTPQPGAWLQPEADSDGDGRKDLDDPLPLDRDNNNVPDRLQPTL
jgi:hypothetical protein